MQTQDVRLIRTLHFGEVEVPQQNIIIFEEGILGFDTLREFVIISEEETEPFKWLISLEEPNIGFPIVDPWILDQNYNPGKKFQLEEEALFSIVTLGGKEKLMTANLKAPIVINVKESKGKQVILPNDKYSPTFEIRGK